jgi:ubiquinone/menaquinone biosynthesis C-methylase UbiE
MHIGIIGDNWIESAVLKTDLVADPLIKTQIAFTMARAIMVGVEVGIFEALAESEKNARDVSHFCQTQVRPTETLLNALVSCEYLNLDSRKNYSLTSSARKWLLRSSSHSICDKMIFQNKEWDFLSQLKPYLKDGKSVNLHSDQSAEDWQAYQKGMADIGKLALTEVVKRAPIPKQATKMLDIGGAGGTYSAAFVKSRPLLNSIILDLPQAVVHAKEIVNSHGLSKDRLDIHAGNALEDDLGENAYDFIFLANVAHHLNIEQNKMLARKAARALKSNGVYCILEPNRIETPSKKTQFGSLLDLYFGLTSQSGTWSVSEITSWMSIAALKPGKTIHLRTAPGVVLVYGRKK